MSNTLKEIFQSYYSPLCNYAYAIIRSKHSAEDIVQSIFIQLWEQNKIDHLIEPEPYLIRCVKYKCLDFLRHKKRRKEDFPEALPDISSSESALLKEEDILPMLHYFADKLPPKMRTVFLMSRKNELSYKEIAARLNISVKTVENHMGQALKKMRSFLKAHHYLSFFLFFLQ